MGKADRQRLDSKGKVRLLKSWLNYFSQEHPELFNSSAATHISLFCGAVLNDRPLTLFRDNPLCQAILKRDPLRKASVWRFIDSVPSEPETGP